MREGLGKYAEEWCMSLRAAGPRWDCGLTRTILPSSHPSSYAVSTFCHFSMQCNPLRVHLRRNAPRMGLQKGRIVHERRWGIAPGVFERGPRPLLDE